MKLTKNPVFKYFVEAKEELEKVTWPTQKETVRYTALVVGICLGASAFLGAIDLAGKLGLEGLLQLAQTSEPAATVQSTDGTTTINLDDITSNGGEVTVTPADDTQTTDDTVDAQ